MTKRLSFTLTFILLLFIHSLSAKERVIILTDIANEPDDAMSMVRLMLYSNEFDLEGLIATTGCWMKNNPRPEEIDKIINAYALVRENLLLHRSGYPSADVLHGLVKRGNESYSMDNVGDGKSSEGSQHIIAVVDKDDPRPVWVCIWGGANTLAQALWNVQHSRSREEANDFVAKLRVYDLAGQDDSGAWMTNTFPYLHFIRSVRQWQGISYWVLQNNIPESRGGDESVFSIKWVDENIQHNHGPLGEAYPDALYLHEGDTPTYLYLIPTGLSDPDEPAWGCWGGRFSEEPQMNPFSAQPPVENESLYTDFWMRSEAADHWQWQNHTYDNIWCAVFRWRVDFQNDFAARMDWCVRSFENANHNPMVVLNQDSSKAVLRLHANPGEIVNLDASPSYDPDGNSLFFQWWIYPEPGTYENEITLGKSDSSSLSFQVPADAARKTLHLILTVRDNGEPPLFAYRRVVFFVEPYEIAADNRPPVVTDYPDTSFIDYREQVPIRMRTDERAFLRFDFADKSFADMQYEFAEGQGGIRHTAWVPAQHGQQLKIYVQAQDMAGNSTTGAIEISFSVDTLQTPISWKDRRYLDKWPAGGAPLGAGYDAIRTPVKNIMTFYLRKTLNLQELNENDKITIRTVYEDGLVGYINGHEIRRLKMPDGDIGYDTPALQANDISRKGTMSIQGNDLEFVWPGDNQIAFEIHQADDGENDFYFDAEIKVNNAVVVPYGAEWSYYDLGTEPPVQTLGGIQSDVASAPAPDRFTLNQNYPNPFNAVTTISYQLEKNCRVQLTVYRMTGQEVAMSVNEWQQAGVHRIVFDGGGLASGLYLFRLQAGNQTVTRKMVLLK